MAAGEAITKPAVASIPTGIHHLSLLPNSPTHIITTMLSRDVKFERVISEKQKC